MLFLADHLPCYLIYGYLPDIMLLAGSSCPFVESGFWSGRGYKRKGYFFIIETPIAIRVDDELEDRSLDRGHDCLHDPFKHAKVASLAARF